MADTPAAIARWYRLGAVVLFLALLFAVVQFTGLRQHMTLSYVHDQFSAHVVSGTLLFILLFCLGNLVQIPGWIFLAAAVLALGKWWGGVVTFLAAMRAVLRTGGG